MAQATCGELGLVEVLTRQLKSPSFDPKKTACLCLSNVIRGQEALIARAVKSGAVMVMVELISDEEDDDDLSNKAYQVR